MERDPCNPDGELAIKYADGWETASSLRYFHPILVADRAIRKEELEGIVRELKESANGEQASGQCLLRMYLPSVVRLAHEAPFKDIRQTFSELLRYAETELQWQIPAIPPSPSSFINDDQIPAIDTKDEAQSALFEEMFLRSGRIAHSDRVMSAHVTYFERFYVTLDVIMREDGPLPLPYRNYIAMMAACRHQCENLVHQQAAEFIYHDGDKEWLQGLEYAPSKLQSLSKLNVLLAHQPWMLSRDHIEELVKGSDAWSLSEVVHAIIILTTYHSLSGVVWGCGITPEVDCVTNVPEEYVSASEDESGLVHVETQKVLDLLKKPAEEEEEEGESRAFFEEAGCEEVLCLGESSPTSANPSQSILRFGSDDTFAYTDFDVHSKEYNVFRWQDYCWEEHAHSLIERFYPSAAALLDEEFSCIKNLTYNSFNDSREIDTQPFRRSIWFYAQRLMGISHDDYQYREVNIFLNRGVKYYVKKVVCYPSTISRRDFNNMGYDLRPAEKAHINLVAFEARRQASLVYGMHAVMKYQDG